MDPRELEAVMLMGRSKRIRDKPFVEVGGRPLFSYGFEVLSRVFKRVLIVCAEGIAERLEGFNFVVEDHGVGPLGAMLEGAKNTTSEYVFITGCDLPLLNERAMRFLCDNVSAGAVDAVVPVHGDGRVEPLHSVYRREKILELDMLGLGGRISDIFGEMRVRFISVEELREYDPGLLTLWNINTEADVSELREFLSDQIDSAIP